MVIEMEAVRTFSSGADGFYKKGERFYVQTLKRVNQLKNSGLAKVVNENVEEEPEQVVPPHEGEGWGIVSMGGGWYEIPSGEKMQGFEEAKVALIDYLLEEDIPESEFRSHSNEDEEVRLIEPETEPDVIALDEEEKPPFEDAVKHVGGGWYELPNGERINGKESAKTVYERGEE